MRLPSFSKWLKIAGGEKAQLLSAAAEASPKGPHVRGACFFCFSKFGVREQNFQSHLYKSCFKKGLVRGNCHNIPISRYIYMYMILLIAISIIVIIIIILTYIYISVCIHICI